MEEVVVKDVPVAGLFARQGSVIPQQTGLQVQALVRYVRQGNLEFAKYNEKMLESSKQGNMTLAKLIGSFQNQSSSELAETKTQMMVYKEKAEQAAVLVADKAEQVVVLAADKEHLTKRSHELELEASVAIECKRMKTEVLYYVQTLSMCCHHFTSRDVYHAGV